ncbi:hypothetical protein [Ruminococcus sp.]|uniref:hypothetical protein n=1 Tax=Ruminococcus sp. TaxID=41978 RepID=UPI000E9D83BB|nr:hypothetical protein [Ruminococcus sp.]HBM93561.1 hypothetical protein [Ruminococcus sp.]HCV90285.1 hypothetical protein [Ruminococcus sp.]
MTITLNEDYDVTLSTALLGYVGETNARPVTIEGMEIDGADRYVLTIDYGCGVEYEVDITGGQWTPTADILRSAQTVSCQIAAKKLSGQEYILVKKSRIFRLRIGAAIGDNAIPSPSVAADALDRIDSIGRQAHADMQTAVTAAETATTAAKNAEKSATTAGVSADTAEQAASRAETAKTSAETSAIQADTARQGAETARAEAVKSQNSAKVSAAQASTAAQQTEADKTITAGYAKTAKNCADSTAADRQAVQTLAEQVTADKATVADHAAKVAEDRTAAEAAAQTAQAVADSLPDDYVTAVEKIAENTADISNIKLTDKELQRRVNALYDMGNGVTHKFETDSETAYAKTIPTGGKLMSVKSVGGRSIVWNQLVAQLIETTSASVTGVKLTDKTLQISGTSTNVVFLRIVPVQTAIIGHKYLFHSHASNTTGLSSFNGFYNNESETDKRFYEYGKGIIFTNADNAIEMRLRLDDDVTVNFQITPQLFDLTAMFGVGNEPSTVEEFEKMFPNDYYQYNSGEIITADTESVVVQGRNLWDEIWEEGSIDSETGADSTAPTVIRSKNYTPIIPKSTYIFAYAGSTAFENVKTRFYDINKKYIGYNDNNGQIVYPNRAFITPLNAFYVRFTLPPQYGNVYKNDIALITGSSGTYAPYHSNVYHILEAIRNLPGYGWSAGTVRSYVDYENKKYYQCVQIVDLGTVNWVAGNSGKVSFQTSQVKGQKLTKNYNVPPNILCSKYSTKTQNDMWGKTSVTGITTNASVDGYIYVNDTFYTDAAAFQQAMQGVVLYYELESPIVTDISTLIDDDFLRNIEVEAGGSVTFKNGNDSYRIPVPSEEEYIVKLSEIGGSV